MAKSSISFKANLDIRSGVLERAKRMLRGAPLRFPQHRVTVGIHETEGDASKVKYDGTNAEITLAEAGMIHEFGAGTHIPERSWLRTWFDGNVPNFKEEMTKAMRAEYEGESEAVALLGRKWAVELRAWIEQREGHLAALAPKTIASKQKHGLKAPETPLLATGQLVNAIKARIDGADA